jgi:hypothetical protein
MMEAEVLHVSRVGDRLILAIKIACGEVRSGQVLNSSQFEARVLGVGFVPPQAWADGIRAISCEMLSGGSPKRGDVVKSQT